MKKEGQAAIDVKSSLRKGPAPIGQKSSIERLKVDVKFLTPVFGGGVEHRELDKTAPPAQRKPIRPFDEVTPIRASAIRGQLRFWWRATIGARMNSLEEMRHLEVLLWGGIKGGNQDDKRKDVPTPGRIALFVNDVRAPTEKYTFEWKYNKARTKISLYEKHSGEGYGAFPLRPQEGTTPNLPGEEHSTAIWNHGPFKLLIDFEEMLLPERLTGLKVSEHVQMALSAWLTFGGYGGRLSRGFGAVTFTNKIKGVTNNSNDLINMIVKIFGKEDIIISDVPALSVSKDRVIKREKSENYQEAWQKSLELLRNFRQGQDLGRNKGKNTNNPFIPGRSRWPEPDTIRTITKRNSENHSPEHMIKNVFPRSVFGLPIVFHFKTKGDPHDQILRLSERLDRLPSSLILRTSSNMEPMIIWLKGPILPEEIYLEGNRSNCRVNSHVSPESILEIDNYEMQERCKRLMEPDPIRAFIKYFKG